MSCYTDRYGNSPTHRDDPDFFKKNGKTQGNLLLGWTVKKRSTRRRLAENSVTQCVSTLEERDERALLEIGSQVSSQTRRKTLDFSSKAHAALALAQVDVFKSSACSNGWAVADVLLQWRRNKRATLAQQLARLF